MQNHFVHGTAILPGVVFLDIVMRILQQKGYDGADYAFENILFLQPVATKEMSDRELLIDLSMPEEEAGRLLIKSRLFGSDEDFQDNMKARVVRASSTPKPDLDISFYKNKARSQLNMADLYGWARAEKINHGAKMRCQGVLWLAETDLLVELNLEVPGKHGFYMHPAALDATTIAAFGQTGEAFKDPFIPVAIDQFHVLRPLPEHFILFAPARERLSHTGDIISIDYDLYDGQGKHCATFKKLTCKHIRHAELITRLVEENRTVDEKPHSPSISMEKEGKITANITDYSQILSGWIAEILQVEPKSLPLEVGFYDLGLDSRDLLSLAERLEVEMGLETYPTLLFEFSHIKALSEHLLSCFGPPKGQLEESAPPVEAENEGLEQEVHQLSMATPEWVLDTRVSSEKFKKMAVIGPDDGLLDRLNRQCAGKIEFISFAEDHKNFLEETSTDIGGIDIDGMVFFSQASEEADVTEYLKKMGPWLSRAAQSKKTFDILLVDIFPGDLLLDECGERPSPHLSGSAAYFRVVRKESPALAARCLLTSEEDLGQALVRELNKDAGQLPKTAGVIFHQKDRTFIQALVRGASLDPHDTYDLPLDPGDVCIISGGGGGIGRLLSQWLLEEKQTEIILLGRNKQKPHWLGHEHTAAVHYYSCDITDQAALENILGRVRKNHGAIKAVFHAAGILRDGLHIHNEVAQIDQVCGAKIKGFQSLDAATAQDDLKVFMAFSSLASWLVATGQSLYACANATLNALAEARQSDPRKTGQTISISWPLWADGHMQLSPEDQKNASRRTGLYPLPTDIAMQAMAAMLKAHNSNGGAALYGDQARIGGWLEAEAVQNNLQPSIAGHTGAEQEIAIVGLAGRFPGAEDIEKFWQQLTEGYDAIREIPPQRWDHAAIYDADKNRPGKTYGRWGGFLEDIDVFDAGKFHISRRDAERMDPQERLFLETCWSVFEEAGHPATQLKDREVGVFAGVMWNHYQLCADEDVAPNAMHAAIANRVSYSLNLTGPSMAVDTACSSSLTAFSLAVDSVKNGQCSMALAGGVNLMVHPEKYRQLAQGQFLSEDGKCRSFGDNGSGYVPGEGVGAVLIRPLRDALRDGDHIWGVVKSCALNHGGQSGGFTVPSPLQQSDVIRKALKAAKISPDSIDYVEAHGTGTALGDPIEVEALGRAYGKRQDNPLVIGSVKSNIGHLESAAGIAAMAKLLLMFKEQKMLPSLHSKTLNPKLPLDKLGMRVQQEYCPWRQIQSDVPLRAAISSFGAGGANAHIILEQPPHRPPETSCPPSPEIILLCARDLAGLRDYAQRMADALSKLSVRKDNSVNKNNKAVFHKIAAQLNVDVADLSPEDSFRSLGLQNEELLVLQHDLGLEKELDPDSSLSSLLLENEGDDGLLAQVAYTLQVCRSPLRHRLAFVSSSVREAIEKLRAFADEKQHEGSFYNVEAASEAVIETHDQEILAEKWTRGAKVDFAKFWQNKSMQKIPLPVVRLSRQESFWIGRWNTEKQQPKYNQAEATIIKAALKQREMKDMPESQDKDVVSLKILEKGVALVSMQDQKNHNMFTEALISGLKSAFNHIENNDDIQCVIVTGSPKVFSLGGTPDTLEALARKEFNFTKEPFIFEAFLHCPVPVIAAIRGHAAGGGLTFGLHADLVILDRQGSYSANFVKFGFTPGVGATYALERRFGVNLAHEMFLTGKNYSGQELEAMGVHCRFEDRDLLLDRAIGIATAIADNPAAVVNGLKKEMAARVGEKLPHIIKRELALHEKVLDKSLVDHIRSKSLKTSKVAPIREKIREKQPQPIQTGPRANIVEVIQQSLANNLFLKPDEITSDIPFSEMGLDSLGAVEIVRDLNQAFGLNLDSVVVYDCPTLGQLADMVATEFEQNPQVNKAGNEVKLEEISPATLQSGEEYVAVHETKNNDNDTIDKIVEVISQTLCHNLFLRPDQINRDQNFTEMGLDSLGAVEIVRDLNQAFGLNVDSVLVYDFSTIDQLAAEIATEIGAEISGNQPSEPEPIKISLKTPPKIKPEAIEKSVNGIARDEGAMKIKLTAEPARHPEKLVLKPAETKEPEKKRATEDTDDIAVIGMSARYPGSADIDEFWQNLHEGRFSIEEIRRERWDMSALEKDGAETATKWAGFIEDIDKFDPTFFGISPREAELMDPQQRIFLEQSWRALEHAGYAVGPERRVNCGIFVGTASGDYLPLLRDQNVGDSGQVFLGNSGSVLAGRIAYFLNLKGPTIALDTACSSSLVAVHMAAQAIKGGDCDMALAGGIGLMVTSQMYRWNYNSGMLSPNGRCSSFDAAADGFVLGEGVGCVILKRLSRALEDRDQIFAVIKASGINGDGKTNGITAPSSEAQLRLQKRVHQQAQVSPDDIAYIETHGAGTQLGDPIEVKALAGLMQDRSRDLPPCGIGSIKSNIGHTTLASGVAGLMKVILGLKHKEIPPSLFYEEPNPNFAMDLDQLAVVSEGREWPKGIHGTRFGAVNSFGVSGTNAHMVLQEAPQTNPLKVEIIEGHYLLAVSAKNPAALEKNIRNLILDIKAGKALMDISYTLLRGRAFFGKRFALVVSDADDAVKSLQNALEHKNIEGLYNPDEIHFEEGKDWQKTLSLGQMMALGHAFCQGKEIDFKSFFQKRGGCRIGLSGYVFNNRRFWLPERDDRIQMPLANKTPVLTDRNEILHEHIDMSQDWVRDHKVAGQNWLPGAALMHYALNIHPELPLKLSQIEWLKPAAVKTGDVLEVIKSGQGIKLALKDQPVWATLKCGKYNAVDPDILNIAAVEEKLVHRKSHRKSHSKSHDQIYADFKRAAIDYGPSYQRLQEVYFEGDQLLARLIPCELTHNIQIMDAILQTTAVLEQGPELRVPRRINSMQIHRPVETSRIIHAIRISDGLYDITACDEAGKISIQIKGFLLAPLPKSNIRGYIPAWQEKTSVKEGHKRLNGYLAYSPLMTQKLTSVSGEKALSLDLRNAPDDAPEAVLENLRLFFKKILLENTQYELRIITAGAVSVMAGDKIRPTQAAIASMVRTAASEQKQGSVYLIDAETEEKYDRENLPPEIEAFGRINAIRAGHWYENIYIPQDFKSCQTNIFQQGKTYLIVGGSGGLGFALSKILAENKAVRLGWIGRSALNKDIQKQIDEIKNLGGSVQYESADLSDAKAMKSAVGRIRKKLGPISGAIHSALALENVSIAHMSAEQLDRVLAPKVAGIKSLYAALEGEPIGHLIIFSSVAAFMDAPGQGNYAAASAYIDAYAHELRSKYDVPAYVVNWGYWGNVGIVAGEKNRRDMAAKGVGSIEAEEGFAWLFYQLEQKIPQMMVMNAAASRFAQFGLKLSEEMPQNSSDKNISKSDQEVVVEEKETRVLTEPDHENISDIEVENVVDYVSKIFSRILKLDIDDFDQDEGFESYGVDSLIGMDILRVLKGDLGDLPSTLLYEYLSITELAHYLIKEKSEALGQILQPRAVEKKQQRPEPDKRLVSNTLEEKTPEENIPEENIYEQPKDVAKTGQDDDIAIVGLSGRYPGAETLDDFWQNLKNGTRSIDEMPKERGDWKEYYHEKPRKNHTYNKWGGFIKGIDLFDAKFFGILPREAATIDPQERLFLESCWDLLEQSGHNNQNNREHDTGVFVGMMYGAYAQLAAAQGWSKGEFGLGHSPYWSVANRISYFFDFKGPSMAVDTACSSSLTAFHLACEALRRGECKQAIAGGINLILHPAHHIALSSMNMLGTGKACRTFDKSADGIIPGEGVGAALLRPLADALRDGDEILAVVKGSMVNAGGKTSGYTVPNPNAQSKVIQKALKQSHVPAQNIDHIEVHGTGTLLGDPIEVAALKNIFEGDRRERPLLVSSVKANIGHLEGAAGIAGLTKAVLQLKNQQFTPCAGLEQLNDKIEFGTCVRPAGDAEQWTLNSDHKVAQRYCGVSSFGAGGANAHVILQDAPPREVLNQMQDDHNLFLLSANSHEQLKKYALKISRWLKGHTETNLSQLCYTSQTGRRHLPIRLAIYCMDIFQLTQELALMAEGQSSALSHVTPEGDQKNPILGSLGDAVVSLLIEQGKIKELGEAWVNSLAVDWEKLWPVSPGKISFPTIPLNRQRYWLPEDITVHKKTGSQGGYLRDLASDHIINQVAIVPGTALMEFALEDFVLPRKLQNFHWQKAMAKEVLDILPELKKEDAKTVIKLKGEPGIYASFLPAQSSDIGAAGIIDLKGIKEKCSRTISRHEFYEQMAQGGFVYGPKLMMLQDIHYSGNCATAALDDLNDMDQKVPASLARALDGAMQLVSLISGGTEALPVSFDEFIQYSPLSKPLFAIAERHEGQNIYDVFLCDDQGQVLARLRALKLAPLANAAKPADPVGATEYLKTIEVKAEIKAERGRTENVLKNIILMRAGQEDPEFLVPELRSVSDQILRNVEEIKSETNPDAALLYLSSDIVDHTERLHFYLLKLAELLAALRQNNVQDRFRLLLVARDDDLPGRAMAAACRSLVQEHSWLRASHLIIDDHVAAEDIVAELKDLNAEEPEVILAYGVRKLRLLQAFTPDWNINTLVRPGGTYVISGGAGAIGQILARHLASLAPVSIILLGRSERSEHFLAELNRDIGQGSLITYSAVDCTDMEALRHVVREVTDEYGPLRGIIHAAGIQKDALFAKKTPEMIDEIIRPKVQAALCLDKVSADQQLDFFMLCSSLVAQTGNMGQVDYSAANRYLADFTASREERRQNGLCSGKCINIEWPLWQEGAMGVDAATEKYFADHFDMLPLSTKNALKAFELALGGQYSDFALVQRSHGVARQERPAPIKSEQEGQDVRFDQKTLRENILEDLRRIGSEYLLVDPCHVELDVNLLELGFDSISLTEIMNKINELYGLDLMPAVLFECPAMNDIADYLVREHGSEISQYFSETINVPVEETTVTHMEEKEKIKTEGGQEDIAVIGISGRFANADTLDEFWQKLLNNETLMGPVSAERDALYGDDFTRHIKAGFLNKIDYFDAERFGISPREAVMMDPQQRIFIESVNDAIQDAGYGSDAWRGGEVGIFAGVSTSDYDGLMAEAHMPIEPHMATGIAHSILANRISHLYDWHGPSEVVDTACSSSLVALNRGIGALRAGECDTAIVGGVNAILSPNLFHAFDQSGMLSPDYQCKTFDVRADGYVRGEGVGVVILRPLSKAMDNKDHIYAIIKGSAVNHGGKSSSLTAPNPASQAQVIEKAMKDIDPRRISYIESHGTGTKLGDHVEIEGLKAAYENLLRKKGLPEPKEAWIKLGAVKTAIGHLEAAAGMAGLLRTILSLKNNYLSANRNFDQQNPLIKLENSPFSLLSEAGRWQSESHKTLYAGVSSFGFGGTNAHVILSSAPKIQKPQEAVTENMSYLFPISAPNETILAQFAARLLSSIIKNDPALEDVAFTLQQRSHDFKTRIVFEACDKQGLLSQLQKLSEAGFGQTEIKEYDDLVSAFLRGENVSWPDQKGRRCALPPLPYLRRHYWFEAPNQDIRHTENMPQADWPELFGNFMENSIGENGFEQEVPLAKNGGFETSVEKKNTGKKNTGKKVQLSDLSDFSAHKEPDPAPFLAVKNVAAAAVPSKNVELSVPAQELNSAPVTVNKGVEDFILRHLSAILLYPIEKIALDSSFSDIGLDSIFRMDLVRLINEEYGTEITGEELYEFDTVLKLGQKLSSVLKEDKTVPQKSPENNPVTPLLTDAQEPQDNSKFAEIICRFILKLTDKNVGHQDNFYDFGLTSFDMLKIIAELELGFSSLPKTLLFDHETPEKLGAWLKDKYGEELILALAQDNDREKNKVKGIEETQYLPSGAIVVAKKKLKDLPDLVQKISRQEEKWAKEGGLPGRDIAPYIFLGAGDEGYLHFTERDGLLLSWSTAVSEENYEKLVSEWVEWASANGFRPNLLSMREIDQISGMKFRSTPFGTVQRINNIAEFSLLGRKMQRLRQKVNHFSRTGEIRVEEYKIGSNKDTDRSIISLIEQWAARKKMVNAYVHTVSQEISQKIMADRHRVFLTKVDDEIVAAIVITKIPSENGYLLDLEFFGDKMGNGGLDYSIVEIIQKLADEKVELFSLGATFGVVEARSSNSHPEVEKTLEELRKTGIFKGDGNFQFKNKYRPENLPIYLSQPADISLADISSILLLIIDPDVENSQTHNESQTMETEDISDSESLTMNMDGISRKEALNRAGQNPLILPDNAHNFNLITDSWAERDDDFIHARKAALNELAMGINEGLNTQNSLPFDYVYAAPSGRAAEATLLKMLAPGKKIIIQTNLFQSWLFNSFDLGFTPHIIKSQPGRADVDLDHLDQLLSQYGEQAGLCCIELAPNAHGGQPLSRANLEAISTRVRLAKIPLVFDATRGFDNVMMIAEEEGAEYWSVVEEIFTLADAVTLSLSKDFGMSYGGIIATSMPDLIEKLQRRNADRGQEVGRGERREILAALKDKDWISHNVQKRIKQTQMLSQCFSDYGIPVKATGVHALLLDADCLCPGYAEPVAATLAWLYQIAAIKAAPHLSSGLLATQNSVRLALPAGLDDHRFNQLIEALNTGLRGGDEISDLIRLKDKTNAVAFYARREELPEDVMEDIEIKDNLPHDDRNGINRNWQITQTWQHEAKRHLIPYQDGEIEVFEAGQGSPIVFLHPFNIGGGFFAPQLKFLASKHKVITIHAPGVGNTTYADDLSFPGLSNMIVATIKSLGIKEKFCVAGASFGGLSALSVACAFPKQVSGLILLGSSHKIGNRKGDVNRLSEVAKEDFDILEKAGAKLSMPREELEALLQDCESMDPKIGLRYLDVFSKKPDLIKKAEKLKIPTLLIHGIHDSVIKLAVAEKLAKVIPNARLCKIKEAGHFPSLSAYQKVNSLIGKFIQKINVQKKVKSDG